jgi:hypothetical protein
MEEAAGGLRMKVGPGARSRYIRVEEKDEGVDVDLGRVVRPGPPIPVEELDDELLNWAAGGKHRMLIRRGRRQYAIRVQEVDEGDLEAAAGGMRMHSERTRPQKGIRIEEKDDGEIDIYIGKARPIPPISIHRQ